MTTANKEYLFANRSTNTTDFGYANRAFNATLHSAEQAHNSSLDLTGRALASTSIVCKAALPYFIIKVLPLNSASYSLVAVDNTIPTLTLSAQ